MISKVTRGKGNGGILSPQDMGQDMVDLAELVRKFMIATAQTGRQHALKTTGGFVESIEVTTGYDGFNIKVGETAVYMDAGRKPGLTRVPISALLAWIKRYNVGGRDRKTGRFTKRTQSITSLAYAIQTAIFKNGIKPRPFLKASLEFAEQLMAEYVEATLIPDILTSIEFILKN